MTRPTDPPESLMAQWWLSDDDASEPRWSRFMAKKGAEYGYQQAMQDRAEIAALLRELTEALDSWVLPNPQVSSYLIEKELADRARAMADKLQSPQEEL